MITKKIQREEVQSCLNMAGGTGGMEEKKEKRDISGGEGKSFRQFLDFVRGFHG